VQRLSDDIVAVLRAPEMARTLADMGIEVAPLGVDDFQAFIQSEIRRFAAVTRPLVPAKN
jgi:tripartite-type tricarboxylate transporter receptor subunit TctC